MHIIVHKANDFSNPKIVFKKSEGVSRERCSYQTAYFVLSFVIDPNTPISWSALLKQCCCGCIGGAKYDLKGDLSEPLVSSSDPRVH